MINTLSTPIADSPFLSTPTADSPLASTLDRSRTHFNNAGSALGRAVSGFAFVGVLAASTELLGPAGLIISSALAMLAIGVKFSNTARP